MSIFVDGTLQDVLPGGRAAPWIMSTYALSFVTSFYPSGEHENTPACEGMNVSENTLLFIAFIAYSIIKNGWTISQSALATSFLLVRVCFTRSHLNTFLIRSST
jgi:hypothetical protein